MKKASTLIALLLALSGIALAPSSADAQSRTEGRGTVKKKSSKRTRTTTSRSHNSRRSHRTHHSHSHRPVHRSGVHVRVGWPYHHYYYNRGYYRPYTYHHTTVVYDRTPEVVVVQAEAPFAMPGLECAIRTQEERAGLQQWCATSRGTKHGLYRRWYADGVLATEGEYDYDTRAGVWLEYHPNGAIREEGAFKDGVRVGTWVTWGSDGEELVVVDY